MAHTLSPLINFHKLTPNSNQLIPYFWTNGCMCELTKKPRLLKLLLMILWQIPGKNPFGRVRLILAHSFRENWSIMRGGKMKVKAVKKHMAPRIIKNQKADYGSQNQKQLQLSMALPQGPISASQAPNLKCATTFKAEHHLVATCSYKWASREQFTFKLKGSKLGKWHIWFLADQLYYSIN